MGPADYTQNFAGRGFLPAIVSFVSIAILLTIKKDDQQLLTSHPSRDQLQDTSERWLELFMT